MEHSEPFMSRAIPSQSQCQTRELKAVSDIAWAVSRSLDLQSTLEVGIRETLKTVGAEAGCVVLLQGKPPRWMIAAYRSVDQELLRRLEEAVRGDESRPAAEGAALDVLALQSLSDGIKEAMREAGFHSFTVLPLLSSMGVFGMVLAASREERLLGLQSIEVLMTVAEQLATAIENARLYQEVQRELAERARAEEALRKAHDELEIRVHERTAELTEANEALRAEIAEHKRAEEALHQSEERYRSLFEGVPVGLYRTTLEGQIVDANAALVQMLGYPDRESLQAVNVPDLYVDPEERKRELSLLEQEGVVRNLEIELRRRDGTMIWARDSVRTVRDADGRVQHYEGVLEDITERRRAEKHLLRTERLAAMGRLSATLAHEINNPLQAISSSLELALDFPLEEAERQEYLQTTRREMERLMTLTDRVLNFSRPPQVERKPIPVADVVRDALALASEQLDYSHIRASVDLPDVLPPVLASSSQLTPVCLNLIINAIEAMPDGGDLSISAQLAGDQVEVTFTDSGPGIPPDVMARLFEPFYTTKENGTGLGLPTSCSIILQHGGTITAGNAPGGGAVFTVALPIALSDKPHLAERSQ